MEAHGSLGASRAVEVGRAPERIWFILQAPSSCHHCCSSPNGFWVRAATHCPCLKRHHTIHDVHSPLPSINVSNYTVSHTSACSHQPPQNPSCTSDHVEQYFHKHIRRLPPPSKAPNSPGIHFTKPIPFRTQMLNAPLHPIQPLLRPASKHTNDRRNRNKTAPKRPPSRKPMIACKIFVFVKGTFWRGLSDEAELVGEEIAVVDEDARFKSSVLIGAKTSILIAVSEREVKGLVVIDVTESDDAFAPGKGYWTQSVLANHHPRNKIFIWR